jgi:hypothetical protein
MNTTQTTDADIVKAFEAKADQIAKDNGWTISHARSVMLRYLRDTSPAEAATIAAALDHQRRGPSMANSTMPATVKDAAAAIRKDLRVGDRIRIDRRPSNGPAAIVVGTVLRLSPTGGFSLRGVNETSGATVYGTFCASDDPYLAKEGVAQHVEVLATFPPCAPPACEIAQDLLRAERPSGARRIVPGGRIEQHLQRLADQGRIRGLDYGASVALRDAVQAELSALADVADLLILNPRTDPGA